MWGASGQVRGLCPKDQVDCILDFTGGSEGEESACKAGDLGSIPGLGRFPGKGNGYALQYFWLGNPMDRGAWWATVYGVTKRTRLSNLCPYMLTEH